jgi:HAD superfamily hydrolase (TIGR01509 family)
MIKWVFFDIGWTLVDEAPAHRRRWEAAKKVLGLPAPTDELMRLLEEASTAFASSPFRHALKHLGLSDDQQEDVIRRVRFDYRHAALYPGVREVLADLDRNYRLGVIANQSRGAEERLVQWGIRQSMRLVLASAELGMEKPDRRIFDKALARAGCRPDEAVMVGDRLDNDIAPAKRLGWRTARVRQGIARFQVPRDRCEEPDCTIDTLAELRAALDEMARE